MIKMAVEEDDDVDRQTVCGGGDGEGDRNRAAVTVSERFGFGIRVSFQSTLDSSLVPVLVRIVLTRVYDGQTKPPCGDSRRR
ncbi:hypothetical protein Hanom_Chr17g01573981 [Helianthus anomalus]